jgi:hypothetical protein
MNEEKNVWLDGQINGDTIQETACAYMIFCGVQDNLCSLVCTFDRWSDKT